MGLREVLAIGSFLFKQEWHRWQPESIYPYLHPKINYFNHLQLNLGVIKVQFRLMSIKPVPVICFCLVIPTPIRRFFVHKHNTRFLVFVGRIAPYIIIFVSGTRSCCARFLKPIMLVRSVVEYQLNDHFYAAMVCFF